MCMSVFFASAKTITYLKGDADGDNSISILDATVIQKTLASIIFDTDGMISLRGEIGGDGLDITDATNIQRYLAGFENIYHINETVTIPDPTTPQPTAPQPTRDPYELPVVPKK